MKLPTFREIHQMTKAANRLGAPVPVRVELLQKALMKRWAQKYARRWDREARQTYWEKT